VALAGRPTHAVDWEAEDELRSAIELLQARRQIEALDYVAAKELLEQAGGARLTTRTCTADRARPRANLGAHLGAREYLGDPPPARRA
jgi:hypothetical protein